LGKGEPLFKDKTGGEGEGNGTGHGDIVDAPKHGEITYATSRKEQGRNNKGICGYSPATLGRRQNGGVVTTRKFGAAEMSGEQFLDELGGGTASAALREFDFSRLKIKRQQVMFEHVVG